MLLVNKCNINSMAQPDNPVAEIAHNNKRIEILNHGASSYDIRSPTVVPHSKSKNPIITNVQIAGITTLSMNEVDGRAGMDSLEGIVYSL